MRTLTARPVDAPRCEHGEGPVWTASDGLLRWVDMLRGDLLTWDPQSRHGLRTHVSDVLAALRPRTRGGFVVALERGFGILDGTGLTRLPDVWSDANVRMNDGSCDTLGRFYCGSMAYDAAAGRGSLHRLNLDGTVSTVLDSVTISNGLAFTPDGREAFYVDSATQAIDRIDLTSGEWESRREFARVPPREGTPDGICIDSAGGVWVALWEGGAVQRYSRDGDLTHRVDLPVTRPTACTLGGPELTDLYITTSTLGASLEEEPAAGALFVVQVDIAGVPPLEYAG